jgi:hypothetical protein
MVPLTPRYTDWLPCLRCDVIWYQTLLRGTHVLARVIKVTSYFRPIRKALSFLQFVALYLEDIYIYSRTALEHVMHVVAVLKQLRAYSLYVKPSKCEWMQKKIQFLAHHISHDSRQADPAKVDVLQNWPSPHSRRELRTLLGTSGYWRPYI